MPHRNRPAPAGKRKGGSDLKKVRLARNGYLMMSVVFYIAGVLYMVLPAVSPLAVCISGGAVLIVYGIIKMIGFFSSDLYCLAFQYDLACGLLLLVLGVILLIFGRSLLPYLSPGLGMLILVDNFLAIQMSYDAKKFGLETWCFILIAAIVTSCFAVLLIVKLCPDVLSSRLVAGLALLSEGLKNQCVVIYTVKVIKDFRSKGPAPT